jgi:hypothetical protein
MLKLVLEKMKLNLIIILFLLSIETFGQSKSIRKVWIDNQNMALIIKKSFLLMDDGFGLSEHDYRIKNDTLFMAEYMCGKPKHFRKETPYHIIKHTKDSLKLVSYCTLNYDGVQECDTLIYSDSLNIKSKLSLFDNLLYQRTYLSSEVVRTKLEIDKKGSVFYWDKNVDSVYYHLQLKKNSLDTLINIIRNSRIENLPTNQMGAVLDNPNHILTLVLNKNIIHKSFLGFPYLDWKLEAFLYKLSARCSNVSNIGEKHVFIEY